MGYTTDYYGEIKFSSKEFGKKLQEYFDKEHLDLDEYFDIEGISLTDEGVELSGYGKMYGDILEKFCLYIARIDKKSKGEIRCKGEESDDMWRIIVEDGKVITEAGHIAYIESSREEFNSNEINKDIYKITKDKSLLKELIVEELEK